MQPPDATSKPCAERADFFTLHPRFFETSVTDIRGRRMEYRHRAIIEQHRDILRGARVLDLASHDGRFSLAALDAGAHSVVGIEGRDSLVNRARENLLLYGIDESRFDFVAGDVLRTLRLLPEGRFDSVLCCGFLYHTLSHFELLSELHRLRVDNIVIDTTLLDDGSASIRLGRDDSTLEGAALATSPDASWALVGAPSRRALEIMLEHLGYEVRYVDWNEIIKDGDWSGVTDYQRQARFTLRAQRAKPWPTRSRTGLLEDLTVTRAYGENISFAEVLRCAAAAGDLGFLRHALERRIVARAATERNIVVRREERDSLRRTVVEGMGLSDSEEGRLAAASAMGMSREDLDEQVEYLMRWGKLKGEVVGDDVLPRFLRNREQFDVVELAKIVVDDAQLALQLSASARAGSDFGALARAHSIERTSALCGGRIGPQRIGVLDADLRTSVLRAEESEVLGPFADGSQWVLYKLERRISAEFDREVRTTIHHQIFAEWLDEQMRSEQVETSLWRLLTNT